MLFTLISLNHSYLDNTSLAVNPTIRETPNFIWMGLFQALSPLLIMFILSAIVKLAYNHRKSIFLWIKKKKLTLLPVNFNIAFSLDFKEGLNSGNYFDQIKKGLNTAINESHLTKEILVKDFSDIKKIGNESEAEAFINKKNIDLIIWGGFTNDHLKVNGENINEIDLHFTYGHPDDSKEMVGKMISLDLQSNLAKKNYWKIVENNSLEDTKIITNNIFDISTYILALTLKIYGRIYKSLNLFERLYDSLLKRGDDLQKNVLPHLYNCYEILLIEYGISKKDYKLGKELCLKILSIKQDDFLGLSNLPAFQYRLGETTEAEENVNKLLKLYPRDPVTEVDVAFFRILQKNYTSAFKHYRNIINRPATNLDETIIEFLLLEYDKSKEPAFLYGSGILSYHFWDKKLAKDNLTSFLNESNEEEYKPMYREAKRILKIL